MPAGVSVTPSSWSGRMFSSLAVRNFRYYESGQVFSAVGTWMQTVAQALLVLQLTGKGADVGIVFALQYVPVLLLGPAGGMVVDRINKLSGMYWTQAIAGLFALILGVVVATDTVELWMVYALGAGLGTINVLDQPLRQTFVYEMVGPSHLSNAIGLNATLFNVARVVGPALAGVMVSIVGLAPCFFFNAASFAVGITALSLLRRSELHPVQLATRTGGRVRDGVRYVWSSPALLIPTLMVTAIGLFAQAYPVSLPLLAKFTFHGGAGMVSGFLALLSLGGVIGGLYVASRPSPSGKFLCAAAGVLGVATLLASVAPTAGLALVAMIPVGAASMAFIVSTQSAFQLMSVPDMRGRVMSLRNTALLGSSAIGGLIVGLLADHVGARFGIAIGGVAAVLAAVLAYPKLSRTPMGTGTYIPVPVSATETAAAPGALTASTTTSLG